MHTDCLLSWFAHCNSVHCSLVSEWSDTRKYTRSCAPSGSVNCISTVCLTHEEISIFISCGIYEVLNNGNCSLLVSAVSVEIYFRLAYFAA
jgi:hypothetical protein